MSKPPQTGIIGSVSISYGTALEALNAIEMLEKQHHYKKLFADDASFVGQALRELRAICRGGPSPLRDALAAQKAAGSKYELYVTIDAAMLEITETRETLAVAIVKEAITPIDALLTETGGKIPEEMTIVIRRAR